MVAAQRHTDLSLRRAAILLSHLDAESRRRLLAHFPAAEASRLRSAAASLADADPLEVQRVVTAFVGRVTSAQRDPSPSKPPQAPTDPPAVPERSQSPASTADDNRGLQFLNRVSDASLLRAVESEHPQTVAVVLASLDAQQAARLLKRLDPDLRREAIRRLGRLQEIPREVIDDIARHLQHLVGSMEPVEASHGRRTLTSIFAALDDSDRESIVSGLGESDGIIASALAEFERKADRAKPAAIERSGAHERRETESAGEYPDGDSSDDDPHVDTLNVRLEAYPTLRRDPAEQGEGLEAEQVDAILENLQPRELQNVLARLESRQAMLTLCGLSPRAVKRLMRSLPRRQAKEVRQRIERIGSLEMREIAAAKRVAAREACAGDAPARPPTVEPEAVLRRAA